MLLFIVFLYKTRGNNPPHVPITGPTLIAGTTGEVFAIDVATGELRWKYSSDGYITAAVKGNGVTYIANIDNNLYALDDSTGVTKWKFGASNEVANTPVLSNGRLYVTDNNGNINALDAQTGNVQWSNHAGPYWVSLYSSGNMVLASNDDNNLYAYNAITGDILWKYATPSGESLETLISIMELFIPEPLIPNCWPSIQPPEHCDGVLISAILY